MQTALWGGNKTLQGPVEGLLSSGVTEQGQGHKASGVGKADGMCSLCQTPREKGGWPTGSEVCPGPQAPLLQNGDEKKVTPSKGVTRVKRMKTAPGTE